MRLLLAAALAVAACGSPLPAEARDWCATNPRKLFISMLFEPPQSLTSDELIDLAMLALENPEATAGRWINDDPESYIEVCLAAFADRET